jgi:hypothetical protein
MKPTSPELPPVASLDAIANLGDSFRAVGIGVAVILGGSLVITTLLGVTAILGMIARGNTGEAIVVQLSGSFGLALLCAIGGWLMCSVGGYVSGSIAGRLCIHHAFWTGAIAMPLSLVVLAVLGDSGPAWLTAVSTALIVPCATFGGWLAAPVQIVPIAGELRQ